MICLPSILWARNIYSSFVSLTHFFFMMNNILQVTRSAARRCCVHFRSRLTTATLLSVTRNKLFYDGRFYCCQPLLSIPCFQYRKPNAIVDERKRFLIREEAAVSHSYLLLCFFPVRGMAGHSKWQNIRHIKGAKDKEKSHLTSKFAQRLRVAVKGKRNISTCLDDNTLTLVRIRSGNTLSSARPS